MMRVVLTGGPCSGKSTVQRAVSEEFFDRVVLVPEAATMLLGNGFPQPGKDLAWSEEWQASLQAAILPLQRSLEDTYGLVAQNRGCKLIVCDRGLLDGAAYTTNGDTGEFCRAHAIDPAQILSRYAAVIHLESLATAEPEKYGKTGNASRFEPLDRAQRLDAAVLTAWKDHPRHLVISGRRGFEAKVAEVLGIIRFLLAEKT